MSDDPIKLEHLSDRELLLLTAKTVNDMYGGQQSLFRRVRKLEHWRSGLVGAFATMSVVAKFGWDYIKEHR